MLSPKVCIFILKFEIQTILFPVSQNWGSPHACFAKMTVTKHISWVQDSHVKVTRQPTTSKHPEHNYRTSEWHTSLTPVSLFSNNELFSLTDGKGLWILYPLPPFVLKTIRYHEAFLLRQCSKPFLMLWAFNTAPHTVTPTITLFSLLFHFMTDFTIVMNSNNLSDPCERVIWPLKGSQPPDWEPLFFWALITTLVDKMVPRNSPLQRQSSRA